MGTLGKRGGWVFWGALFSKRCRCQVTLNSKPVLRLCDATCVPSKGTNTHCTVCHRTFGGDRAFRLHRPRGKCRDLSHLGYVVTGSGVVKKRLSASDLATFRHRSEPPVA